MSTRTAKAEWKGNLKEGNGNMEFGSGAFKGGYSFSSRMENGSGTNPEELIAAAHAGCFSMAFSNELSKAGFTPNRVNTTAKLDFNNSSGAWTIARIDLETEGDVPGIDEAKFRE